MLRVRLRQPGSQLFDESADRTDPFVAPFAPFLLRGLPGAGFEELLKGHRVDSLCGIPHLVAETGFWTYGRCVPARNSLRGYYPHGLETVKQRGRCGDR